MIQRLRWKFVLINMSLVLVILLSLCAVLMATTQDSLRRDSLTALDQAVTLTTSSTPSYSVHIDPGNEGDYNTLFGTEKVQLPYFTVQITGQNTLLVLANQFFDTSDQDTLLQVVNDALSYSGDSGPIDQGGYHLRFLRVNTMLGYRIAFVDLTQERSTLNALARNLVFVSLGTLAVSSASACCWPNGRCGRWKRAGNSSASLWPTPPTSSRPPDRHPVQSGHAGTVRRRRPGKAAALAGQCAGFLRPDENSGGGACWCWPETTTPPSASPWPAAPSATWWRMP